MACLALVALLASCGKEPQEVSPSSDPGDGSKDPVEQPSEDPGAPKSTECKLSAFVVNTGVSTIEAFVDPTDKTIEISYMPNELDGLKAATAEVTISDKATIDPDPTKPIDYTVSDGVKFTVTAEDGEAKTEYTAFLAAAEFTQKVEKVWQKKFGQLGLGSKANYDCGIAFVDTEHFAYADLQVFDLDGNKVGDLNTTGVTGLQLYSDGAVKAEKQLTSMTNDCNGVLVAITAYTGILEETGGQGCCSEVYAWIDGWDKAPTKIYGPAEYQCNYMSVAGDVKGDFILNFRTGVTAPPQMHHVMVYKGGKYYNDDGSSACTWYGPKIEHPCDDGCWGQQLSFFSGNPDDGFVVWDSIAAAEMGETGNASAAYYVYYGFSEYFASGENVAIIPASEETPLFGQVTWAKWDSQGQWYSYGNYSTGHVRAFIYNGVKCIIASSSSWPCTWITIQKAEDLVIDDEETDEIDESEANYLLSSDKIEDAGQCVPCSAYVYDPVSGTGHVLYTAQSSVVAAWDLITDRL